MVWSLHKHERFDLERCPSYMLSPCPDMDPWPSEAAQEYVRALARPEELGQDELEAISLEDSPPSLLGLFANLSAETSLVRRERPVGVVASPPYPPTVFIATAEAIAGETIPHTAPWEQVKSSSAETEGIEPTAADDDDSAPQPAGTGCL